MAHPSARHEDVLSERYNFFHPALQTSGQLHTPTALPLKKKKTWYPLTRTLGGPQSRSGRSGEAKNLLSLAGI